MAGIFISYRRGGTRADTGRLYDRLSAHFGDDSVFMDINDIAPGENFTERLETTLASCDVMLVMISSHWIEACSEDGKPRLGSAGDFVTLEVQQALNRDIHLIPILVDGAEMPAAQQLPAELSALAQHQAMDISDQRFHQDVDTLIAAIEHYYPPVVRKSFRWFYLAVGVALLLFSALFWFFMPAKTLSLRNEPATLTTSEASASLVKHDLFDKSSNTAAKGVENQLEALAVNQDVVVVDSLTGLMWQKGGSSKGMTFSQTRDYVESLNVRRFAGYDDWRLPSYEEAMSLMKTEKKDNFYLDPAFDVLKAPFIFTSDLTPEGKPWVVYYHDGIAGPESEAFNAFVRVVRSNR